MSVSYNIYRMPKGLLKELIEKISDEGLVKQKSITRQGYKLIFYFSDKLKGNEVWWWDVFNAFFKKKC